MVYFVGFWHCEIVWVQLLPMWHREMKTMQKRSIWWVILFIRFLRKGFSITSAVLISKTLSLLLISSGIFRRSYVDFLKSFFEGELQATQSIFSSKEKYEKILGMITDEGMKECWCIFPPTWRPNLSLCHLQWFASSWQIFKQTSEESGRILRDHLYQKKPPAF